MTTKIDRLIIFGDSLSDIGVKRKTWTGAFAAMFHLMRTNQVNRYSDNRNWTDFIWEWAGGQPLIVTNKATSEAAANPHLTWSANSKNGSPTGGPLYYVNYAEGGAMGGSDRPSTGLGTFREQFERYKNDLKTYGAAPGNSLYLIWFGLNDLVTNERESSDMKKVADQMVDICHEIIRLDSHANFLFGNLPDPQDAVRFMGKEETAKIIDFSTGSFEFGHELANKIKELPKINETAIVDLFTPMYHVCKNLSSYGFTKGAQPSGIEVRYGAPPKNQAAAFLTTTSDEAHPTEEVYKVIAQIWATEIRKRFDWGTLSQKADAAFTVKGNK
ncbi:MAG TPA: SGNH/GDSL hydrolase family protein [Luteibacter sp.]|jgi:phospholipase/lecithinase/hemolysin|uniref:SGNH/GDSL hydrolase family protein n=1 Tax=Luteibacter sp. TaxID=1886636 RepID=UPI002F427E39